VTVTGIVQVAGVKLTVAGVAFPSVGVSLATAIDTVLVGGDVNET
jgi:hypothetical protein